MIVGWVDQISSTNDLIVFSRARSVHETGNVRGRLWNVVSKWPTQYVHIYILYVEYINDFVQEVICGNVISYWPSNIEHASTTSISHSFHHTWSIWNLNIIAQNYWPPQKTKMITVTVRFDLFSPYFFQPTKINNTHILTISIGVYHGSCEVANIGGSLDSKLLGATWTDGGKRCPPTPEHPTSPWWLGVVEESLVLHPQRKLGPKRDWSSHLVRVCFFFFESWNSCRSETSIFFAGCLYLCSF